MEENVRENPHDLEFGRLLKCVTESIIHQSKTGTLNDIKIKNFCYSKGTAKNNENTSHSLRTHLQKTHLIKDLH